MVERAPLEEGHVELVGHERLPDMRGKFGMPGDRREVARTAALVGDLPIGSDAERERRVVVEEERRDVVVVDEQQDIRLLFREGDTIGGKQVKSFTVLKAVSGSPGVTRAFNDAGQVVWRATFLDGTTAIVVTTVP